jgi:aminopeptidase N
MTQSPSTPADMSVSPGDSPAPSVIFLKDYQAPAWRIRHAELVFDLDTDATEVATRLHLEPGSAATGLPLQLHGEQLALLSIAVDDAPLAADRYRNDHAGLTIFGLSGRCVLETRVRIHPERNTQLEGLYASRGLLLTQCEAEGFRRITYFLDRPDVLSTWRTTLRAKERDYPVLLANGNPVESGSLGDGRHFATWENPHPTPCYLFALVAGKLASVDKQVETAEGRNVRLAIWAAPADVPRCGFALEALERALRWDEQRFGRCYDLDVYNLVAAQDFTMGAMENKGLNIFNARYVLADSNTATDADYIATEAVIGHEYFHNWSGNRVTLRDWFQLSLKEGFTVFRDQEFTADLHSRSVKRIEDVQSLRARQFSEDAGALAHPVRPDSFREINNFYTATVYDKGAEVVRMLHTLLGEETFRKGCDRYFADNDGRAVTVEDFLSAMAAESGRGLEHFARWYAQAGTPEVTVADSWNAESGVYEMTLVQQTPPTPGQAEKLPVSIPLRLSLFDQRDQPLTTSPISDARVLDDAAAPPGQFLVELTAQTHHIKVEGLTARPLPALNQGFAAPIKMHYPYTPADLGRLARIEIDSFNRWEALQRLSFGIMLGQFEDVSAARQALGEALADLLADDGADPAFAAECLQIPGFDTLAEMADMIDVDGLLSSREALLNDLTSMLAPALEARYHALAPAAAGGIDGPAMAARALRNGCLDWLTRIDPDAPLAESQYAAALNMTERMGALRCLVRYDSPGRAAALKAFQARYPDDDLVTDKWLALVATRPQPDVVEEVALLIASPWWIATNPNRVRAILGAFSRQNAPAFHRADGAGYRLLADQLPEIDRINSQVAARLLGAFESWGRLAGDRRKLAQGVLQSLRGRLTSRECGDVLSRLLGDADISGH